MNAYELAKYIEDDIQIQEGIADMLCEQADELNKVVQKLVKANGLIENLRIRIAELEQNLSAYIVELELHKAMIQDLEKQVEHYKNKAEYLDKRELELLRQKGMGLNEL